MIASSFWVDRVLFQLFFTLIEPSILAPELLKDRKEFVLAESYEGLNSIRPLSLSEVRAHLVGKEAETFSEFISQRDLGVYSPCLIVN